jgi:hypothetical protein
MSDTRNLIPQTISGRYLKLPILKNWLEKRFGPNKATANVRIRSFPSPSTVTAAAVN